MKTDTEKHKTNKKSIIHDIINDINNSHLPQTCLQPSISYIKKQFRPYIATYVITQLIIILLLLFILFTLLKHIQKS